MPVIMIYKSASNCVIGGKGFLLWEQTEEAKLFDDITAGHSVVMGHGTWHSLGNKPLPGRENIVLSRKKVLGLPDRVFSSLSELTLFPDKTYFIIGGKNLFESFLNSSIKIDEIKIFRTAEKISGETKFFNSAKFSISESRAFAGGDFLSYLPNEKSSQNEEQYLSLVRRILLEGIEQPDRTGTGVRALFGQQLRLDLRRDFPLLTTKRMAWKAIQEELFFFLRGLTDTKKLEERGVNIWREQTSRAVLDKAGRDLPEGEMGPMYGYQWRNFGGSGLDQIKRVIEDIRRDPFSRRLMITTFNPVDAEKGVLWPCHGIVLQFFCREEGGEMFISAQMYQRSADVFLGLPFNIASYSLLLHLVARSVSMLPDELIIQIGNAHLYSDHFEQARIQLERKILVPPKLEVIRVDLENPEQDDVKLWGYFSWPGISARLSV